MATLARIRSHTALRGVAALLVVAYHLQFGGGYRLAFETATPLFQRSYLFVDLFFIMSGFIIAYVSRADDRQVPLPRFRDFLFARVARLYPLHLVVLFAFLGLALAINAFRLAVGHSPLFPTDAHSQSSFLSQLFLVNAWYPPNAGWNVPSWSISAEFVAYALFPLLAMLRRRSALAAELGLLSLAFFFYAGVAAMTGSLDIIQGLAPLRCVAGFMLGMGVFYRRNWIFGLPDAVLSGLQVASVVAILLILLGPVSDPPIIVPFTFLVATSWSDRGLVAAVLGRRFLVTLGDWSYSIYLVHVPVLSVLSLCWQSLGARLPLSDDLLRFGYILLAYGAVIAVSAFTFRWIEVPMRHRLAGLLLREGRSPIPTGPAAP